MSRRKGDFHTIPPQTRSGERIEGTTESGKPRWPFFCFFVLCCFLWNLPSKKSVKTSDTSGSSSTVVYVTDHFRETKYLPRKTGTGGVWQIPRTPKGSWRKYSSVKISDSRFGNTEFVKVFSVENYGDVTSSPKLYLKPPCLSLVSRTEHLCSEISETVQEGHRSVTRGRHTRV